jgi:hypothetical protein
MAKIDNILKRLRDAFPRKKLAFEASMRAAGIEETIEQRISKPKRLKYLSTFKDSVRRPMSPMLAGRFQYAGTWEEGLDIWLGADQMRAAMKRRELRTTHKSLREHWEGSAPMLYTDDQLTLFGITSGVSENVTYLVWTGRKEPEVWTYVGMNSNQYKNLAEFLESQIEP